MVRCEGVKWATEPGAPFPVNMVVIIAALSTVSGRIPGYERSAWYASLFLTPAALLLGGRHFILLPPDGEATERWIGGQCSPSVCSSLGCGAEPEPLTTVLPPAFSSVSRKPVSGGIDEKGSSLPLQPLFLSSSA